jgi:hypothetical protein
MVSPGGSQVNSSEDEIQQIAWIENIGWSLFKQAASRFPDRPRSNGPSKRTQMNSFHFLPKSAY